MAFPYKPVAHLLGSNGPVHALAYSASPGTYVLTGSADRAIRLYNPRPGDNNNSKSKAPASSSSSSITASSRQQQQQQAAGAAGEGGAAATTAADLPEGRLIQSYSGHGYDVLSLAVAGDNARFASCGGDRTVFLWDVATATTLRRFGSSGGGGSSSAGPGEWGHTSRVNCVAFAGEDDSILVSGGFDTTVKLWDCKGGGQSKPIQTLSDAKDGISALAARGAELVAGSVDGRVRTYDVRMGRCVVDVVGASVTSLGMTRDGAALLVGSLDSRIRLMDRRSGECLRTYRDEGEGDGAWRNESLRVQSLLGGGERFVVAGDEMSSGGGGAGRGTTTTGGSGSGSGSSSGGGSSSDEDGRVWVWDLLTGRVVTTLRVPWGPLSASAGEKRRRVIGRDGKEKVRKNIVSCLAWREDGWGDQFCVGGSSGAVTVFGKG